MTVYKKFIQDNELYLYMNGKLIYKKSLNTGQSLVFDVQAYRKYESSSVDEASRKFGNGLLEINAIITLLSTSEGGRKTGFTSGYRPNHVFEYQKYGSIPHTYIGDIVFNHAETIEPGESQPAVVRFLSLQYIEKYLEKGRIWWLHEGARRIGKAEVC